jgi:glycosyltransferase involved in cell wall biosynthesis
MSHANLVALLAKKLARSTTRVVASERSNALVVNREHKNFRSLAIRSINWFLYRTADKIHAVSHGVAAACAEQLGLPCKKIAVVYNPIMTEQILDLAKLKVDFSWLGKDQKPLILAAGSLTKPKDFPALICAFGLLRAKLDACLVILGEGELRSELQKLITELDLQDSVALPGFLDNPFSVMKQADLFVLSSAYEGLPNVLIQAMACGTPVVSTDCPSGPSEILENGKWGRLVPVGNVEALAQAMWDTLAEPKHPDVARRAAYFSVERAVDGYLRLLLPENG